VKALDAALRDRDLPPIPTTAATVTTSL